MSLRAKAVEGAKFGADTNALRRYVLRHHPFLAFLVFVPSFLLLELLAAGIMWAVYAHRLSTQPQLEPGPDRRKLKADSPVVKLEPLEDSSEAESTLSADSNRGERRGMTAVEGSETEDDEFSESASAGEWEQERDEQVGAAVKEEFDDAATIGGVSAVPLIAETQTYWLTPSAPRSLVRDDKGDGLELWPLARVDVGYRHVAWHAPLAPERWPAWARRVVPLSIYRDLHNTICTFICFSWNALLFVVPPLARQGREIGHECNFFAGHGSDQHLHPPDPAQPLKR